MQAAFRPLSGYRAKLGESPVWSEADRAVWWVDIAGRRLIRTGLDGDTRHWPTPEIPGFVQCLGGQVLVGMQSGIFRFQPGDAGWSLAVPLDQPGQRFNDACQDDRGRIWAGTMDLGNATADGALYLYDPGAGSLQRRAEGFRTLNGLAWDAARSRLYLSDSHPKVQTVWTARATPEGVLTAPQVFAGFEGREGRPDGAALDPKGQYWIAGVGGATLYRFAPDGTETARLATPQRSPTKPAFIGWRMALTSFVDEGVGGRLALWDDPCGSEEGPTP